MSGITGLTGNFNLEFAPGEVPGTSEVERTFPHKLSRLFYPACDGRRAQMAKDLNA